VPFSASITVEYNDLIKDKLNSVTFENSKDVDDYCSSLILLVSTIDPEIPDPSKLIPEKYREICADLQELINEGFDLYATIK
jgi:hypothetical protein